MGQLFGCVHEHLAGSGEVCPRLPSSKKLHHGIHVNALVLNRIPPLRKQIININEVEKDGAKMQRLISEIMQLDFQSFATPDFMQREL